jgi:hypothetical protein
MKYAFVLAALSATAFAAPHGNINHAEAEKQATTIDAVTMAIYENGWPSGVGFKRGRW